jgi:hypothetical protein
MNRGFFYILLFIYNPNYFTLLKIGLISVVTKTLESIKNNYALQITNTKDAIDYMNSKYNFQNMEIAQKIMNVNIIFLF